MAFRRALMRMARGTPGSKNLKKHAQQQGRGWIPQIPGQRTKHGHSSGALSQIQEAVKKIREHEEKVGRKFEGGIRSVAPQQRIALSREKKVVMENIRKIIDPRGLLKAERDRLRGGIGGEKEIHDILTLFYNALLNGEVRNFKDFEIYMANFLKQSGQNPKYASVAVKRIVNAMGLERRSKLEQEFRNLAAIARGNSPFD